MEYQQEECRCWRLLTQIADADRLSFHRTEHNQLGASDCSNSSQESVH